MVGHEIESEFVFTAIDSVPCFELWYFVSPKLDSPLLDPLAQQGKCARDYFTVFVAMLAIRKTKRYRLTAVLVRA